MSEPASSTCPSCGVDHDEARYDLRAMDVVSGPACHCVNHGGVRVAVGICCGRMVGEEDLRAEDEAAEARRARKVEATR